MLFKDTQDLEAEVTLLESRLQDARAQLAASEYPSPPSSWAVKGTQIYTSKVAYL
jgi:urease accessory protein